MLTSSYIHIPGIGKVVEKKIWSTGTRSWDEFLERKHELPLPCSKSEKICQGIEESMDRLEAKDSEYFATSLPSSEHWRAFRSFSDSVAYVDIETTGLSPSSSKITVIGIYNGNDVKSFVSGINLDDAIEELLKYKYLVTFNGARFDLPFIKKEYPQIEFKHLHADIMYSLRRIGYIGGLKQIEEDLGISRTEDTIGIDGLEAIRLWNRYERGNDDALDLLLEYNREDIVNLEKIIKLTYEDLMDYTFESQ
ncbi:ribonuclease H-like domain-containing protein [Methanohalophilus sp.]|uniref:ribonuclease H-like domain-containing protein n=1 Tax=Methanohalophilus sp. TaxID=1966352 RepID=UPI0026240623|nr:ribonuclease H-like domain-containing protein [Methanohalophilus sp.]MDK2892611.1 uncharacterized protein [Methanohalophilus sp.]